MTRRIHAQPLRPCRQMLLIAACASLAAGIATGQAGTLDSSFGDGGKVVTDILGEGYSSLVGTDQDIVGRRDDGSIVVLGTTTDYSDVRKWSIARFLGDGTPDVSFGNGGWVTTLVPTSQQFSSSPAYPTAVALDGQATVVLGHGYNLAGSGGDRDFVLVRYLDDGTLDPDFGIDGIVPFDSGSGRTADTPFGIAIRGGRILVAFNKYDFSVEPRNPDLAVAAFLPDGCLDPSFGDSGVVTIDLGGSEVGSSMVAREDGSIVLLGSTRDLPLQGLQSSIALVGLQPNGALDPTFGAGGTALWSGAQGFSFPISLMRLLPDGGVAFHAQDLTNTQTPYSFDQLVLRFGSSGTFLGSFHASAFSFGVGIAAQSDGKFLITGSGYSSPWDFVVARYFSSGVLDTSFGIGGVAKFDLGRYGFARHVDVQSDGKILLSGTVENELAVARVLPGGTLDPTFGGGTGFVSADVKVSNVDETRGFSVMQGDGKLLVLAQSQGIGIRGEDWGTTLIRYNPDGSLDSTFGQEGLLLAEGMDFMNPAALGLQSDGRILVLCTGYNNSPVAVRSLVVVGFEENGTLDLSFGANGYAAVDRPDTLEIATSMSVQADDRIVISGWTRASDWDSLVVRLLPGGDLDADFASGGTLQIGNFGIDEYTEDSAVSADGRIAIAWRRQTYTQGSGWMLENCLEFVEPDGSSSGCHLLPHQAWSSKIEFDELGCVLIGFRARSGTPEYNLMAVSRILPNGQPDETFGSLGIATMEVGVAPWFTEIAVQGDRKPVLIGRTILSFDPPELYRFWDFAVARWNVDGTPDTEFGNGGFAAVHFGDDLQELRYPVPGFEDTPVAVAIQGDGAIVLAGHTKTFFGYYDTPSDIALARFHGLDAPEVLITELLSMVLNYAELGLLNHGQSNALQKILQAAVQQIENGNLETAAHQIAAFINVVEAFIESGILSSADGQILLNLAEPIRLALASS